MPLPDWVFPDNFTPAERAVTSAVLRGESREDIARARATSVHTVRNQIARIFRKTGVTSAPELARHLRREGARQPSYRR
jgi:DNA-binding NarL/FixJ family response regulator